MMTTSLATLRRAAYVGVAFAISLTAEFAVAEPRHGLAVHGQPKYSADFTHLDYANPDAPKGGTLRLAATGSFDTLNPWVIKGRAAAGTRNFLYETLMKRIWDEPFSMYGLIAESAEMPDDRSSIEFTLRPEARFNDGSPITVDDVIFSWETIRTQGRPNSRATFEQVARVEQTGATTVKFVFKNNDNRELPLLIGGFLPILSKAYWEERDFTETSLDTPVTSGPYVIEALDPGRSITYRRDPDYWGAAVPVNVGHNNFDVIRYEYYRDSGVALEAFKAGDFDMRMEFNPTRWATQYDFPAARNGRVALDVVDHGIASGLRGFYMNLRRPLFQDRRVRQALLLAFDFEWVNENLFHSAYTRTRSLFDNSDLRPEGQPDDVEAALLDPWRGQVPAEVFGTPFAPPTTDGSGNNRANLREATRILAEAGWQVRDGKLVNEDGAPFAFEILLVSESNEGIALAYERSLKRLGMDVTVRLVDSAQYQSLIESFDFDMIVSRRGVTLSPGNEQQNYWGSTVADNPGTRNVSGIKDPAIDAMIGTILGAEDRETLVAATRALDRILMWNYYVIPLYHQAGFPTALWDTVARPDNVPVYGAVMETFWSTEP